MKKTIIAIFCVLALVLSVTIAQALIIPDSTNPDPHYLGNIVDGIPSGVDLEISYLNNLITLPIGTDGYTGFADNETYYRTNSTIAITDLPAVTALLSKAETIEENGEYVVL